MSEAIVQPAKSSPFLWLAALLLIAHIAIERLHQPSDLMDFEQQRQAAYVMDAVQDHHWIFQLDKDGALASKPPLFTWLGAGVTLMLGTPELSMRLVAVAATATAAILVVLVARKTWGNRAAFCAVAAYLLNVEIQKQIGLARMDSLLPLTVTLGALAALRAWETGRGWIVFWLAGAASTLTKTPAGILLSACGLLAILWERRTATTLAGETLQLPASPVVSLSARARSNLRGVTLFLAIVLGWYFAAAQQFGSANLYHKLIVEEFLSQSVVTRKHLFPGEGIFAPPGLFLFQFFPWSIPLCMSLVHVVRLPSPDRTVRRRERFLFCWFVLGMILLGISTHQRGDLALPLFVPAALLTGDEIGRWVKRLSRRWIVSLALVAIILGPMALHFSREMIRASNGFVPETAAVASLADDLRSRAGAQFSLTHVDDPFALCVDLNTMRPLYYTRQREFTGFYDSAMEMYYDYNAAGALLRSDAAVFECVSEGALPGMRQRAAGATIYDLAQTSSGTVHVISNRPELREYDSMTFGDGTLLVRMTGLRLVHASATDFVFNGSGSVAIENMGDASRKIHAVVQSSKGTREQNPTIRPAARWEWTVP